MKNLLLTVLFLISALAVSAQSTLTIHECYTKARENYPLIKLKDFIAKSREYNISNVWKGYFPQITISGQATHQSDVTSIPFSIPGTIIDPLSKDQYRVVTDVTQVIYDGGIISAQADIQRASADADDHKIEIELLKLKEKINHIYFGILLLDEQLVQTDLIKKELNVSFDKLSASFANGTATKPSVDILKVELLKLDQRQIEMKSSRKAFVEMLGLLINQRLEESQNLELPVLQNFFGKDVISRPELNLYASQKGLFDRQKSLSIAKILPKASLFFQGGYGKPTLNMLKNNFDWFYITGARFIWQLSNLYTYGNESEIIELNKKSVNAQIETFLLNTNLSLKQQSNEIEKLNDLIKVDKEIIVIRASATEAAKSQLENGVITSSDFIRELNAEDQAKQNLAIHTIQLLLAMQNYKLTIGN